MCNSSPRYTQCGCEGSAPASAGEVAARRKSAALAVRPCPARSSCGSCRSCVSPKHLPASRSARPHGKPSLIRGALAPFSLLLLAVIFFMSPGLLVTPAHAEEATDLLNASAEYILSLMHATEDGGLTKEKFTHMVEHALSLQMAVKRDMYNVEAPDHAHGVDDEHDHDEDDGHVHRKLRHDVHRDHTHEEDDHDHDHEHDDEHLHEDELTEDAHSTYDMLSAESLFDAYKGEDDLLGIEELKAAATELTGCMLDENCLLTWEGALAEDVHDHDDGDDDGISVTGLKVIFVFALMAEDIVGGLIGIFAPRLFGDKAAYVFALFNMFGGGVFLAVGITHVLPHATEAAATLNLHNHYPLGGLMLVVGFLLIFYVDRIIFSHHTCAPAPLTEDTLAHLDHKKAHNEHGEGKDVEGGHPHGSGSISTASNSDGWAKTAARVLERHVTTISLFISFNLHSIVGDGLAIGLMDSRTSVIKMYVAVAAHSVFAAMIMTSRFVREGMSKRDAFLWVLPFSIDAPIGLAIGIALDGVSEGVRAVLLGISAGTLVYVGAFEVLAYEFGAHHHDTVAPVAAKQSCVHDDEKCPVEGERVGNLPTSTSMWLRNQLFLAYVVGVLAMALIALVPHAHDDHDHAGHDH